MLVRHMLCGAVIGVLATLAGLLVGFVGWWAVMSFLVGASFGLAASALGALSCRSYRARRPARALA